MAGVTNFNPGSAVVVSAVSGGKERPGWKIGGMEHALWVFGPPMLRQGLRLIATPWSKAEAASPFSIGTRLFGSGPGATARETSAEVATLPYMGVGYTGLSVRSGWSFSADLGLVAQNPGGLKLIRSQSLDDAVREMRLAPLLQFGVSYAF